MFWYKLQKELPKYKSSHLRNRVIMSSQKLKASVRISLSVRPPLAQDVWEYYCSADISIQWEPGFSTIKKDLYSLKKKWFRFTWIWDSHILIQRSSIGNIFLEGKSQNYLNPNSVLHDGTQRNLHFIGCLNDYKWSMHFVCKITTCK